MLIFKMLKFTGHLERVFALCLNFSVLKREVLGYIIELSLRGNL